MYKGVRPLETIFVEYSSKSLAQLYFYSATLNHLTFDNSNVMAPSGDAVSLKTGRLLELALFVDGVRGAPWAKCRASRRSRDGHSS